MGADTLKWVFGVWEGSPIQQSIFLVVNLLSLPFQSLAKAGNQEEGILSRTGEELKEYFGSG